MKRVGLAAGLLLLALVASLVLNGAVGMRVNEVMDDLNEGELLADQNDFDNAQEAVLSALSLWKKHEGLCSVVFPAHQTHLVTASLMTLREQLSCRDYESYKASNALLVAALTHLLEDQEVSWKNIL